MYWQALADILPLVRRPISNHTILVSDCIHEFTRRSQMLAVQFLHLRIEDEGKCFFLSATNQSWLNSDLVNLQTSTNLAIVLLNVTLSEINMKFSTAGDGACENPLGAIVGWPHRSVWGYPKIMGG